MATEEEFERWHAQQQGEEFPADPEVKIKPDVKFLGEGDHDYGLPRLTPAEAPTVKARVLEPYRIVCGGIFTGGDVFDAPHNDETRLWLQQGWIELVRPTKTTRTKKES